MKGFKHFFATPHRWGKNLVIRGIGVQEHMPACAIDRPAGTGDHLFMFFYDPMQLAGRDEPRPYPAGAMVIWTPGCPQYYASDAPYRHTWIHCDGGFVRAQVQRHALPCNRPFHLAVPTIMERYLLAIHEELTLHVAPDGVIVRNLLENWLREINRLLGAPRAVARIPPGLLAARHMLESEYERPITLRELAARACLSVSHFCAAFKRYFGSPAIDYLIQQRLRRAAALLQESDLKVQDVARRVGYDDIYHFSKLFKKHYGHSPDAFRRLPPGAAIK